MKNTILKLSLLLTLGVLCLLLCSGCAHTHAFGEWTVAEAATCLESGREERTCSCGETESREIPPLGHGFGEWQTLSEPGCEAEGLREHTCLSCGYTEKERQAALGHVFSDWSVLKAGTCTEAEVQSRQCSACGEIERKTIAASGHQFYDWHVEQEATCTEQGQEYRICSQCGQTETRAIAALGHTTKSGTCSRCGKNVCSWIIKHYVDDFGDPTDSAYVCNSPSIVGSFKDYLNDDGYLEVTIIADKTSLSFFLFKYKFATSQVTNSSSENEIYSIQVRTPDGVTKSFQGYIPARGGDRVYVSGECALYILSAWIDGLETKIIFSQEDKYWGTTSYRFDVEPSNFLFVYKELLDSYS